MIFDTHVHLNLKEFEPDFSAVFQRARDAGVRYFLNVGIDFDHSRENVEFASKYENVYATVGLHPHDAQKFTEEGFREIKKLARHPKVKAIGEIGLDYFRNLSPKNIQQEVFAKFAAFARETDLPVVIHSREAYSDIYSILRQFGPKHRGLMHCFSGNKQDLENALDLGLHISIAGPVTYKKNDELRGLAKLVPQEKLLVETDAPFLPPEPFRGKRNEPAMIVETVKKIAEVRGVDFQTLSEQTTQNAKRLFNI